MTAEKIVTKKTDFDITIEEGRRDDQNGKSLKERRKKCKKNKLQK